MDTDCDKPIVSCRPCSEKLPLVLSSSSSKPVIQVPASISQYLHGYQREGVRFLYQRFKDGEGGILADDMGLGKTVQAIAFISAVLQMKGTKEDKLRHCCQYIRDDIAPGIEIPSVNPVLIICPASLCDNWLNELETWGHFKAFKISTGNRMELINRAKHKECDVVISTFECARSGIDQLNAVDWTCVFVDEVHRIKDATSQISKALNSLHCQFRYGLTGTPFQNDPNDVTCLLKWCNSKLIQSLGPKMENVPRLMQLGNRSSATKRDITTSSANRIFFTTIRDRLVKRRTKQILSKVLPLKTDQIVFCKLTNTQENIYRMITESSDVKDLLNSTKVQLCNKAGRTSKSMSKRASRLFTYLHLLQKTANHVGLLVSGLSSSSNETTREMCQKALEDYAGLEGISLKRWPEAFSDVEMSGKMIVLSELLPVFMARGDKILVFSYSTKILDLVESHLKKKRFKYWRLDGSTPPETRFAMVGSFNNFPDPAIFLLSTKAGGVGLNIVGANVVIIFDPNWNPAYDLQAQDRAYRLGQERDVRVYRLLSTSTIEEFVYLRQVYKQQLSSLTMTAKSVKRYFNSVSGDPRYYGELFGIKNLFSFRDSGRSLTEELLEKQRHVEKKLRLKIEAPIREKLSMAYVSPCVVSADVEGDKCLNQFSHKKSGLAQLCEDVFEAPCEDPVDIDSDDGVEDCEKDVCKNEKDGIRKNDSIHTLLESVVRHVVEHEEVVAPSSVEEFITDCAIRDVLQKGINSQLPAFDCSIETQEAIAALNHEDGATTTSRMSHKIRLKFNEFAKRELLNTFELATKVLAMSRQEKIEFLKKHQKRQCQDPLVTSALKKARQSLETHSVKTVQAEEDLRTKPLEEPSNVVQTCTTVTFSELGVHDVAIGKTASDAISPSVRLHEGGASPPGGHSCSEVDQLPQVYGTQSSCSEPSSSPSSSFEKDVSLIYPSVSKDTLLAVKKLIRNPVKKAPSKVEEIREDLKPVSNPVVCSYPNEADSGPKKVFALNSCKSSGKSDQSSNVSQSSDFQLGIDGETGFPSASVDFIKSLFFSNVKKKPSPKKGACSSSSVGRGVLTVTSCREKSEVASIAPDNQLTSQSTSKATTDVYDDLDLATPLRYQPKDDVYQKLLTSGKLKRV